MKKLFLLFIIIIPFTAFAQSKKSIDGFFDIPFGSDSGTVKKVFLSKGATPDHTADEKDFVSFTNFIFSNRKVSVCLIKFVDNKAYEADFYFADFIEKDILSYYDSLSDDIKAVYGKGDFSSNFSDSEDNTKRIWRLKSGNDASKWLWVSKNKNVIALQFQNINHFLHVELIYQDVALLNILLAKRRSDF